MDAKENSLKGGSSIVLAAVGFGILPTLIPSGKSVIAQSAVIDAPVLTQQVAPLLLVGPEASVPMETASPENLPNLAK